MLDERRIRPKPVTRESPRGEPDQHDGRSTDHASNDLLLERRTESCERRGGKNERPPGWVRRRGDDDRPITNSGQSPE